MYEAAKEASELFEGIYNYSVELEATEPKIASIGKHLHAVERRVGFRKIEIRGKKSLVT